jgi:hypothetical protein
MSSLNFFMGGVLTAGLAELADFQSVLMLLLVFRRRVISILANRTL